MKIIANILMPMALWLVLQSAMAQREHVFIQVHHADQALQVNLSHATDISIIGYEGDSLRIITRVEKLDSTPLPTYAVNVNNTYSTVYITDSRKYQYYDDKSGNIWNQNVSLDIPPFFGRAPIRGKHRIFVEITVPHCKRLNVSSVSGNIEIRDFHAPQRIETVSGFIDLTWPIEKDTDWQINTVAGKVYTNLPIERLPKPTQGYISWMNYRLGIGGQRMFLRSLHGNIYLRAGS